MKASGAHPIAAVSHRDSTAGAASVERTLVSGTAVPALAPEVGTAPLSIGRIEITFLGIGETVKSTVVEPKRPRSKRAARASEMKQKFDMMPAYSERQFVLPRAVRSSLATKAKEEMSEFEQDYPW